jgi:hypothetical protein
VLGYSTMFRKLYSALISETNLQLLAGSSLLAIFSYNKVNINESSALKLFNKDVDVGNLLLPLAFEEIYKSQGKTMKSVCMRRTRETIVSIVILEIIAFTPYLY